MTVGFYLQHQLPRAAEVSARPDFIRFADVMRRWPPVLGDTFERAQLIFHFTVLWRITGRQAAFRHGV